MKTNRPNTRQRFFELHDIRVIDGDTVQARILLPFGVQVQPRIRMRGWWAPEREGVSQAAGDAAAKRLEDWLQGKEVFLFCPTPRLDKHGRAVGHLWWNGKIVDPRAVLGEHALTQAQHDAIRRMNGHNVSAPRYRPYKDVLDMDLKVITMGYVNRGEAAPVPLQKEWDERFPDQPFPSRPAHPERSELPLTKCLICGTATGGADRCRFHIFSKVKS